MTAPHEHAQLVAAEKLLAHLWRTSNDPDGVERYGRATGALRAVLDHLDGDSLAKYRQTCAPGGRAYIQRQVDGEWVDAGEVTHLHFGPREPDTTQPRTFTFNLTDVHPDLIGLLRDGRTPCRAGCGRRLTFPGTCIACLARRGPAVHAHLAPQDEVDACHKQLLPGQKCPVSTCGYRALSNPRRKDRRK